MLYFSELDNTTVYTSSKKKLGYLRDLIFSVAGTPYIKKLVVETVQRESPRMLPLAAIFKRNQAVIIPVEHLHKMEQSRIIIDEHYMTDAVAENELYVKKNLLDTQVIDIEDNNIVRVNDVLIDNVSPGVFVIYGVDIGISGILRWFGLEDRIERVLHAFHSTVPQFTLAWSDIQPLELSRGRVVLNYRFDKMKNLHPADLADYLETQTYKNVLTLTGGMDKTYLAKVFSEINPSFQVNLFKRMPAQKSAHILSTMDPDDAVDVIAQFSSKKREELLKRMKEKETMVIRRLLKFNKTPLGKFLNSEFISVGSGETAREVTRRVKTEGPDLSVLDYIYVVNKENALIGVFDLKELLMHDPNMEVFRFMKVKLFTVSLLTPVDVAFRRMIRYKVSSLPVIDAGKRILGVVTIDDLGEEILTRLGRLR